MEIRIRRFIGVTDHKSELNIQKLWKTRKKLTLE